MSNYTPTTAFGPKDALANGDPSKVILGTQIDTEYDNIATAIATKLDSSVGLPTLAGNNTFTGQNIFGGSGAEDLHIEFDIASVDSLWIGTNNSGATNAVGAPTGADYLFTNQGRSIVLGTASTPRVAVTGNGNLTVNAPSAGAALFVTGLAGAVGLEVQSASTSTSAPIIQSQVTSSGNGQVNVISATNAIDADLNVIITQIGATTKSATISPGVNIPIQLGGFLSHASAGIKGFGPTAAAYVDMTPDSATFAITATGFGSGGTGTGRWSRKGTQVTLYVPLLSGTSNATGFSFSLPSAIQPSFQQFLAVPNGLTLDNTANVTDAALSVNGGTAQFFHGASANGWTASGLKTSGVFTVTYLLS